MDTEVTINESELIEAAKKGAYFYIQVFVDKYRQILGEKGLSGDKMALLNASQHTLLAYDIFRTEMLEGGFCQLIQNGYGSYLFLNPFPKVMKMWGLTDFSKLLYHAEDIYRKNRSDLERQRDDEEFMAMYEQYEKLSDMDDKYIDEEEGITLKIAHYVDNHLEEFTKIVKVSTQ